MATTLFPGNSMSFERDKAVNEVVTVAVKINKKNMYVTKIRQTFKALKNFKSITIDI